LEEQKELTKMELAADIDSDAYKEDRCENNELESELQEEQEAILVRSQNADFHNVQEGAGIPLLYWV
jgi:DNA primase catalytic subunit